MIRERAVYTTPFVRSCGMTDINDAFATRIPMVGANTVNGMAEVGRYDDTMVLPPMNSSSQLYQPSYPNTSAHDQVMYATPSQTPLVYKPSNYVIEGSPEHRAMAGGPGAGSPAAPVLTTGNAPAAAPAFVVPSSAAGQGGQGGQGDGRRGSPGYFDLLAAKRREVVKLLVTALMITLGFSVHWVASYYTQAWIGSGDFTDRQEFFARVVYPLGVLFVIWNIKAFQPEGGGRGG